MATPRLLKSRNANELIEAAQDAQFDWGLYRPYFNDDGQAVVALKTGNKVQARKPDGSLILNAVGEPIEHDELEEVRTSDLADTGVARNIHNATSLRYDTWRRIDAMVTEERLNRLRVFTDLASRVPMESFDAFATPLLEWETESDDGEALQDMDMVNEERNFASVYQRDAVPVPITHAGWFLSKRQLRQSQQAGTPLDLRRARKAVRRIFEKIEKVLIGIQTGITYGVAADYAHTPTVWGLLNYPGRATKTNMSAPTGSNGTTVLSDWLALRDLLYQNNYFGDIVAYVSTDYDQYLDNLFSTTEPSAGTLRENLLKIAGLTDIRRLDNLTNTFTVIFVVMDPEVIQAIVGQQPTTIQWDEMGGFLLKFRTWAILSQRIKEDFSGRCGIAVGTTS